MTHPTYSDVIMGHRKATDRGEVARWAADHIDDIIDVLTDENHHRKEAERKLQEVPQPKAVGTVALSRSGRVLDFELHDGSISDAAEDVASLNERLGHVTSRVTFAVALIMLEQGDERRNK